MVKQLRKLVKNLSKNIKKIKTKSTSEAVLKCKNEKYSASIASEEAAKYYNMKKLYKIYSNSKKENITKFFVIGKI